MRTIVISAFPASGKTYMYSNCNGKPYIILDVELNKFKYLEDKKGKQTLTINPEFPQNYVDHVKNNIGKVDVIFVTIDREVRKALIENGVRYFLVYPDKKLKKEWLRRLRYKGSPSDFISYIIENFDVLIDQIEHEIVTKFVCRFKLFSELYISNDMIEDLDTNMEYSKYINDPMWLSNPKYLRNDIKALKKLENVLEQVYTEAIINHGPVTLSVDTIKEILKFIRKEHDRFRGV